MIFPISFHIFVPPLGNNAEIKASFCALRAIQDSPDICTSWVIIVNSFLLQTTPRQYTESPSESSLKGLTDADWLDYVSNELSSLNDEAELSDRLVYLCMKVATPLSQATRPDVKTRACQLCGMYV